jgi:hypothetical protein
MTSIPLDFSQSKRQKPTEKLIKTAGIDQGDRNRRGQQQSGKTRHEMMYRLLRNRRRRMDQLSLPPIRATEWTGWSEQERWRIFCWGFGGSVGSKILSQLLVKALIAKPKLSAFVADKRLDAVKLTISPLDILQGSLMSILFRA